MPQLMYEQLEGFFATFAAAGNGPCPESGNPVPDGESLALFLRDFADRLGGCGKGGEVALAQASCKNLGDFFAAFGEAKSSVAREPAAAPDMEGLNLFFRNFGDKIRDFRQSGENLNIFDVCSLGRDEIRNCRVLAWLLDENGSHGLGNSFLRGLLQQCGTKAVSPAALASGYAVRTEYCPNGDNSDRVDIVCDGRDFLLYIEVKIDSLEHGGQTARYHCKLDNCAGRRECAVLFISRGQRPASPDAISADWLDCAAALDRLAAEKKAAGAQAVAAILGQYARFIGQF